MKCIIITLALLGAHVLIAAQSPLAHESEVPALEWLTKTHDFGTISYRQPETAEFVFINHSTNPVLIAQAKGSCGCTVTDYTKEAIAPGERGTIKATYNAAQPGAFNKTVSVTTSANQEVHVLRITGTVAD